MQFLRLGYLNLHSRICIGDWGVDPHASFVDCCKCQPCNKTGGRCFVRWRPIVLLLRSTRSLWVKDTHGCTLCSNTALKALMHRVFLLKKRLSIVAC